MSLISEALNSIPHTEHLDSLGEPPAPPITIQPNRKPLIIGCLVSAGIAGAAWALTPGAPLATAPMDTAIAKHRGDSVESVDASSVSTPLTQTSATLAEAVAAPAILEALPNLPVRRTLQNWTASSDGDINRLTLKFNAPVTAQATVSAVSNTTSISVRLPNLQAVSAQGALEAPGLVSSQLSPGQNEWVWALTLQHAQDIRVGADRSDEGRLVLRYRHAPQTQKPEKPAATPPPPESTRLTMARQIDKPEPQPKPAGASDNPSRSSSHTPAVLTHQSAVRQAASHARRGDNATAVTLLIAAERDDPNWNASAAQLLTRLLMIQQRHEEAMEAMYRNIDRFPEATPLRQSLAQQLLYRGLPGRSIEILGAHRPDMLQEPDYYATLAQAYFRHGHHDRAAALYTRLLQFRKDDSVLWAGLGVTHEARNDPASAQAAYRQAIQAATANPRLQQQLRTQLQRLETRS